MTPALLILSSHDMDYAGQRGSFYLAPRLSVLEKDGAMVVEANRHVLSLAPLGGQSLREIWSCCREFVQDPVGFGEPPRIEAMQSVLQPSDVSCIYVHQTSSVIGLGRSISAHRCDAIPGGHHLTGRPGQRRDGHLGGFEVGLRQKIRGVS